MTGEKNRYNSVEKLWEIDGETLKTPKHDEMILWLLKKKNAMSLIFDNNLIEEGYEEWMKRDTGELTYLYDDEVANMPTHHLAEYKEFHKSMHKLPNPPSLTIRSEVPILTETKFIIGYWDIVINWEKTIPIDVHSKEGLFAQRFFYLGRRIYIEVKPKINSFGATLRQLHTYKVHHNWRVENWESNCIICLFTSDLRFKEAFESQGIKVIDANNVMGD